MTGDLLPLVAGGSAPNNSSSSVVSRASASLTLLHCLHGNHVNNGGTLSVFKQLILSLQRMSCIATATNWLPVEMMMMMMMIKVFLQRWLTSSPQSTLWLIRTHTHTHARTHTHTHTHTHTRMVVTPSVTSNHRLYERQKINFWAGVGAGSGLVLVLFLGWC